MVHVMSALMEATRNFVRQLNVLNVVLSILRRLRSDLLNPKFGSQKSALL